MLHTPSPWHLGRNGKRSYRDVEDSNNFAIAQCFPYGNAEDFLIANANAQLISAAPELLEALKAFLDLDFPEGALDNTLAQMAIDKALKAIAKAEGK